MSMPPGMLILGATETLRLLKRRSLTGHLLLRLFSLALGAGACRDRAEALDCKVENADSPGCSRLPKRHVLETEAGKACFTWWICTHIWIYLNDCEPMTLQPIISVLKALRKRPAWEAAQRSVEGKELRVLESERRGLAVSHMEDGDVIRQNLYCIAIFWLHTRAHVCAW